MSKNFEIHLNQHRTIVLNTHSFLFHFIVTSLQLKNKKNRLSFYSVAMEIFLEKSFLLRTKKECNKFTFNRVNNLRLFNELKCTVALAMGINKFLKGFVEVVWFLIETKV